MKTSFGTILLALLVLLSGCSLTDTQPTPPADQAVGQQSTATATPTDVPPTNIPLAEPTNTSVVEPIVAPTAEPPESPITPIEVTYFTPSQAEGPYYTVDKPADRDNDLTQLAGASTAPAGEVIEFGGKLYDADGLAVAGAVIEIWQTDNNGVYLHPGDSDTDQRDVNFQFYGEATTAADGSYNFRTILPGAYEPRPRHIHVKVKRDEQELLTTQFYFANDPTLANEGMFTQEGSDAVHMVMNLTAGQDAAGNPIFIGQRDIVLRVAITSKP